jgi:hypothetical protein
MRFVDDWPPITHSIFSSMRYMFVPNTQRYFDGPKIVINLSNAQV